MSNEEVYGSTLVEVYNNQLRSLCGLDKPYGSVERTEALLSNLLIVIKETRSSWRSDKDFGGYCGQDHLLPFRTEKLSCPAPMVLGLDPGRVGRRQFYESLIATSAVGLSPL